LVCNDVRAGYSFEVPGHATGGASSRKENLLVKVSRGIARYAYVIDVFDSDPCGFETVSDRLSRKACTVLTPIETLLLDGGDKLAVTNDGCRCVTVICVDP
jgi:hypothetical protein